MVSVLKLEYDGDLIFKKMVAGEFVFSTVFELSLSEDMAIKLVKDIRSCLRDKKNLVCEKYESYEVDITCNSMFEFEMGVTVTSGEMSRPLGSHMFSTYMGGKGLLDGTRIFLYDIED